MRLSEPVSGSHVASATGAVPLMIPPSPYCSSIVPLSDSNPATVHLLPSQKIPKSTPDPTLFSVLSSDPQPHAPPQPLPSSFKASSAPPAASDPVPMPLFAPNLTHLPGHNLGLSSATAQPPPPPPHPLTDAVLPLPLDPTCVIAVVPPAASQPSSAPYLHLPTSNPISSNYAPSPPSNPPLNPTTTHHRPHNSTSVPPPLLQRPPSSSVPKGPAPPPQQLSYAQAARSSRGPSFIRAHAKEVETFGKIPRTGVNIICGSKEGIPSFSFVSADLPKVEELYSNALVMKFLGGRPSLESSHREILSWGIEHPFSIGPLTSRAFLLRFQSNVDLLKVLSRPSSMLITFPYKVFRWHNLCHLKEDSCLAPVWISLPRLPLQCFIPEFLEAVGNKIGRFLCFDKATTTLARPSAARICVELDLRKPPPESIWVGLFDGFRQPIIYERMPKFCNGCHALGHLTAACKKTYPVPPPPPSMAQTKDPPSRTQPVRQNAPLHVSSTHQGNLNPNSILTDLNTTSTLVQQPTPTTTSNTAHPSYVSVASQDGADMANRDNQSHQNFSSVHPNPPRKAQNDSAVPSFTIPLKQSVRSRHSKGKQRRKSVSFDLPNAQKHTNLIANQNYWDAVNRQVAILEQARINPLQPSSSIPPGTTVDSATTAPPATPHITQSAEDSSGSSIAADSQPNSPNASAQDVQNQAEAFIPNQSNTYDSEGEDPIVEPPGIDGHETDGAPSKRPQSSKRNKRHPDQPLKLQLRVRKDPNSTFLC